jgi:hypothetical protein
MEGNWPGSAHAVWLRLLLAAFLLRVAAQPLARLSGWRWLPPFEAWQSGALPSPVLLASQLVLAALMTYAATGVSSGRTKPRPALGRWVAAAAGLYATVMVPRLVLGLTLYRGHWWLDAPLPTVFHLVLMTFLAVYGHYHLRGHPLDRHRA